MPTTVPAVVPTTVPELVPVEEVVEEIVSPTPIYQMTIHYVDESGNQVADDYTAFYVGGDNYARLTPAVEGYIAETAVVEGVMPQADQEITVVYHPYSEAAARDYNIEVLTEENVPLASLSGDGTHVDALLPFAAMFVSLLTQAWYVSKRKKYQAEIYETKAQSANSKFN